MRRRDRPTKGGPPHVAGRLDLGRRNSRHAEHEKDLAVSHLLVAVYDDRYRACEVRVTLRKRQRDHLLDLEDAATVTKESDLQLKLQQTTLLTSVSPPGGEFWGGLLALLLFPRPTGLSEGSDSTAPSTAPADFGIDEPFTAELRSLLRPGTSALFVLVRRALPDVVLTEMRQYGGHLMDTPLARDAESQLTVALRAAADWTRNG